MVTSLSRVWAQPLVWLHGGTGSAAPQRRNRALLGRPRVRGPRLHSQRRLDKRKDLLQWIVRIFAHPDGAVIPWKSLISMALQGAAPQHRQFLQPELRYLEGRDHQR